MKFSSAFFALVPLVAALPSSTNVVSPAPAVGNVFICSEPGFTGICVVVHATSGQCVNVPASLPSTSSFGPDPGLVCFVFDQVNCAGHTFGPIIGGTGSQPAVINPPIPFQIASLRCTST
ncbi:hypothetical protein C8J57DRAFT_1237237 [Mycena rebaudengoi]|nr:hypothetical protein C8J57DRAFT_1237237 [Mycena rebaudengoi]